MLAMPALPSTAVPPLSGLWGVLGDVGPINVSRLFSADDVMSPYIYVFYAAFIVTYLFTPIMRWVAIYYGIIDAPDNLRKMHSRPVAYLGGVAVFLGWISGLAFSQFLTVHGGEPSMQ